MLPAAQGTCYRRIWRNGGKTQQLKDGVPCLVVTGTHKGNSGIARDLNESKTGHLTITVVQANGERFKNAWQERGGQSLDLLRSF